MGFNPELGDSRDQIGGREPQQAFETARLSIRLADLTDAEDLIAYDKRNAEHLRPWEPVRDPETMVNPERRRALLAQRCDDARADRGYNFLARLREGDGAIAASVNLSNVVRGPFQACHIGYSVDAEHQGTGLAYEAVAAVVNFAFDVLGLHRVMANYQPSNQRSGNLLRRLGFVPEGYARDYLYINGVWRDHILTSRIKP
jgi:ribosomal-protein-alanine N-acetyltransferase